MKLEKDVEDDFGDGKFAIVIYAYKILFYNSLQPISRLYITARDLH